MLRPLGIFALLAMALLLALTREAGAEFLQTGPYVYQSTTLRERVVVAQSVPGLFLLSTAAVDLQLFDPSKVSDRESVHAFLRFDLVQNRFDALLIGRREYRINGSFELNLGDMRVSVDNDTPYVSIVLISSGSILGFKGLEMVVNQSGWEAISLLEANQFNQYRDNTEPYWLTKSGLYFKNKILDLDFIGVSIAPPRNACLEKVSGKKDLMYLTRGEFEHIKTLTDVQERLQELRRLNTKNRLTRLLKELLLLRIEAGSVVGLNYRNGEVYVLDCRNNFMLVNAVKEKNINP